MIALKYRIIPGIVDITETQQAVTSHKIIAVIAQVRVRPLAYVHAVDVKRAERSASSQFNASFVDHSETPKMHVTE